MPNKIIIDTQTCDDDVDDDRKHIHTMKMNRIKDNDQPKKPTASTAQKVAAHRQTDS